MPRWMVGFSLLAWSSAAQPVTLQAPSALPRGEAAKLLAIHNRERASFGYFPMTWDANLEAQAQAYAHYLARRGKLIHAPKARRPGQGENLAMGAGPLRVDRMAGGHLAGREKAVPARRLSQRQPERQLGRCRPLLASRVAGLGATGMRQSARPANDLPGLPLQPGGQPRRGRDRALTKWAPPARGLGRRGQDDRAKLAVRPRSYIPLRGPRAPPWRSRSRPARRSLGDKPNGRRRRSRQS